jgi:hypothetical protein
MRAQLKLNFGLALDAEGYPTEDSLDYISNYNFFDNYNDLLQQIKEIWVYSDRGYWNQVTTSTPCVSVFNQPEIKTTTYYKISTAGWSGNEMIIMALKRNHIFWNSSWLSSRRGGHYEFEVIEIE